MSVTIALYSHDAVGLGHARRNRAIAHALAERLPALAGDSVGGLLIAGHPDAAADPLPAGWDWLILPGFARTSDGYASRHLHLSTENLAGMRSRMIGEAIGSIRPDLLIVDRHPFGVDGELRQALGQARRHGTRTVLGLREVLDHPEVVRSEWDRLGGAAAVAEAYDALWVYGDPRVYDCVATGELPPALAEKARSTGYLSLGRPADLGPRPGRPFVLTIVGGGSDGAELARAAVNASVPQGYRHVLVTGPQMPESEVAQLRIAADSRTEVVRQAANVPDLIRRADAVISMGGYNSISEILATATPALIVPRAQRRAEQPRRAAALQAARAVDMLPAAELSADQVSTWWHGAVLRRTRRDHIDRHGLSRIAHLAAGLMAPTPRELAHVG